MKKLLSVILAVMLVVTAVVALCACDFGEDKLQITFYHTMGADLQKVLNKYIEKFEEIYPGIKINHTQVGGYNDVRDQTSKEIQVGQGPNIAYCYSDHVALYNKALAVATLDDYIASTEMVEAEKFGNAEAMPIGLTQEQIDDFIPGYYNEGKTFGDGKMYTMPFSKSTEVLYYNKTFFEQHKEKIAVPTHWWCTESCPADCKSGLEKVLREIKSIDDGCIPLGYDSEGNWFITMCEQLGTPYTSATGENFLFDDSRNYEFVKRFAGWYADGLITTQTINNDYTSSLFKQTDKGKSHSYMSIGSSAGATKQAPDKVDGEYPFEVGIEPIPQVDPNNPKVIAQGPSVCILNKANKDEVLASWLFIKYLATTPMFQIEFSGTGYVPVIQSVKEVESYASKLNSANGYANVAYLAQKVCLDQANAYYTSPAFEGSSEARDQVGDLMVNCFKEAMTKKDSGGLTTAFMQKAFADAVNECKYYIGQ